MAHAFRTAATDDAAIIGWMEPVELELVVETLEYTRHLLDDQAEAPDRLEVPTNTEDELFASLSASMQERPAPQDPALRRLLPDAGADEQASAEFRRLTEDGIRRQKTGNLDTAAAAFRRALEESSPEEDGHEVRLSRPEARAAMMALTDVRLVLAARLEITTDADAEELHELVEAMETPRSERDVTAMYYDFVTWLSESLTVAYLGQD